MDNKITKSPNRVFNLTERFINFLISSNEPQKVISYESENKKAYGFETNVMLRTTNEETKVKVTIEEEQRSIGSHLSTAEASIEFNVSKDILRAMCKDHILTAYKGTNNHWNILRKSLEKHFGDKAHDQ